MTSADHLPADIPAIAFTGALAYDLICSTPSSLLDPDPGGGSRLINRKLTHIYEGFGGCAGNLAFNFALRRQPQLMISCTGSLDDSPYLKYLQRLNIDTSCCMRTSDAYSARAVIFTDPEGQQFTGFFPGPVPSVASWEAHLNNIDLSRIGLFIQAPYPPHLMLATLRHIDRLANAPLKVFAPGQYADQLQPHEIVALIELADWVIGNEHEMATLQLHRSLNDRFTVRTHAAAPVELRFANGASRKISIPAVANPVDPTGCGDAFLAGFCQHLVFASALSPANLRHAGQTMQTAYAADLEQAVHSGAKLAAACLVCPGPQQHTA